MSAPALLGALYSGRLRQRHFQGLPLFSFPRQASETGSLGGVEALKTLNVVAMVSGICGEETARRMASVEGTLRCSHRVRRTSGGNRSGGTNAAHVVGRGIHGRCGPLLRSGGRGGVGRPFAVCLCSSERVILIGRPGPVLPGVENTAASGCLIGVAPGFGR